MTLRIYSGGLLLVGSSLAASADCCCGDVPCSCSILKSGLCKCINAAYGSDRDVPDMLITIAGDPPAFLSGAPGACTTLNPDNVCPDIRGTYVLSCGDALVFCWDDVWCDDPVLNQRFQLRLDYQKAFLNVRWTSTAGTCPPFSVINEILHSWIFPVLDDWLYQPSTECRSECNTPTTNRKCADQLDWTYLSETSGTINLPGTCRMSGYTVTLEAA